MWSLLEFFPEPFLIQVLDIGAAYGDKPPYQALVDAKRCRVIGFEPNQEACNHLNQTAGPPHRFFPYFVGDGQRATFYETNWALTGSLYEPNSRLLELFHGLPEQVRMVASHPVDTTRLDDLDSITDIDLIKIDIQGGELRVFENALRILSEVAVIQSEVNFVELYKQQPLFSDVDRFLRSRGFQLHNIGYIHTRAFTPVVIENEPYRGLNQSLWADAIFVRDWLRLDELPPLKLKKYAVIVHDLYASYDLAHLILEALDRKAKTAIAPAYLARLTGK